MTEEDYNSALECTAATGAYMACVADGSIGDLSDEEAFGLASKSASYPSIAGNVLGFGAAADVIPPDVLRERLLEDFYDAQTVGMMADAFDAQDSVPAMMKDRRERTMFALSGATPEDIGRVMFDKESGDNSAYLAMQERFFLSC